MAKSSKPRGKKTSTRKVEVVVRAQDANQVVITGDFTNWSTDSYRLAPEGDGRWRGVLELPPGEYQYRLLVDGQWRDHAAAAKRVPNPFGTENCVLTVS